MIVHAEQVANGVVVFIAIEPAQRDAAWVHRHIWVGAVELSQLLVNEFRQQNPLIFSRLFFIFRRHLAVAQHLTDALPHPAVLEEIRIGTERLEVQLRLGPLIAVAAKADVLHERINIPLKLCLTGWHNAWLGFLRLAKRLTKASRHK